MQWSIVQRLIYTKKLMSVTLYKIDLHFSREFSCKITIPCMCFSHVKLHVILHVQSHLPKRPPGKIDNSQPKRTIWFSPSHFSIVVVTWGKTTLHKVSLTLGGLFGTSYIPGVPLYILIWEHCQNLEHYTPKFKNNCYKSGFTFRSIKISE